MECPQISQFRGSPILLANLDHQLICHDLSDLWRRNLNLTPEEDVEIPVANLFFSGEGENIAEQLGAMEQTLTDIPVALMIDGELVQGLLAAWRVKIEGQSESCIMLLVTDTSQYSHALDELMWIQNERQLILNAAGEGIYGLDCEGRTTFANKAAEQILGWSEQEVLGKPLHDIHHHSHKDGSHYPREDCPVYAAIRDGEVQRVDSEVFWRTDGSCVPVEYTSTPIWMDGKLKGAVCVFRDITERKRAEAEQIAAYKEIKKLKEQLEQERDYLRDEINVSINFGEIIGESPALKRTMAQIEAVAATPTSVLVLGESGVGKEMIARAIHANSDRIDFPLVKVNCASIPKELFESEFFGHIKGAFTGAHRDRIGRLELADNGTLFLDEVGEIPIDLQGKLLRALQEQEFERVGDEKTLKVNVRIVAATNKDLEAEVKAGRFREDLYYRLSVFPIQVPALRERVDDIVPLATHFLEQSCRELKREPLSISRAQANILMQHNWPGNIRELKNVIERAVILSKGTRLKLDQALQPNDSINSNATIQVVPNTKDSNYLTDKQFRALEKANMLKVLQEADWRISGTDGAAELLGLKASTFTYRMKVLGIEKK